MLGDIVGLTAQASGCDACLVYLLESASGDFVLRASQVPRAHDLGDVRVRMGEGVTGWVAEHQAPVALSSHASEDPRFKSFSDPRSSHFPSTEKASNTLPAVPPTNP